jgi:hypothetical protein
LKKCESENDEQKKEDCIRKCVQNYYGSSYAAADSLNPLYIFGSVSQYVTSRLEGRLRREGTRESYNGRSLQNRSYETGRRQLRTLGQFRRFNLGMLVIGIGAATFQGTAYLYCNNECS